MIEKENPEWWSLVWGISFLLVLMTIPWTVGKWQIDIRTLIYTPFVVTGVFEFGRRIYSFFRQKTKKKAF